MTTITEPKTTQTVATVEARNALVAEREALAGWEAKLDEARTGLAELEATAGDLILADPTVAEQVESRLTVLRSTVRATERAASAQAPRVKAAESRYLAAEADALESGALAAAREALAAHEATTQRLLKQLEKHEGVYVPQIEVRKALRSAAERHVHVDLGPAPQPLRSHALRAEVRHLEDQVTVLREMAAGRDPREWERQHRSPVIGKSSIVEYPACVVGPEALVPTPAYLESVERLRGLVTDLEDLERSLPEEIAEWEERAASAPAGSEDEAAARSAVVRRRSRLADVPGELAEARRSLAALTERSA